MLKYVFTYWLKYSKTYFKKFMWQVENRSYSHVLNEETFFQWMQVTQNLQTYLLSRYHSNLKSEFQNRNEKVWLGYSLLSLFLFWWRCAHLQKIVDSIEQPTTKVALGGHVFLTVGDYYLLQNLASLVQEFSFDFLFLSSWYICYLVARLEIQNIPGLSNFYR